MIRLLGTLVLSVSVGAGLCAIRRRQPDPIFREQAGAWRASAKFVQYHQIRPGDLGLASDWFEMTRTSATQYKVGQYLLVPKNARDIVFPRELAEFPPLVVTDTAFPVLMFPTKDHEPLLPALEPEMFVKLCSVGDHTAPQTAAALRCTCALKIVVLHRPTSLTDSGWVALRVPAGSAKKIFEVVNKASKPIIVPSGPDPLPSGSSGLRRHLHRARPAEPDHWQLLP